MGGWCWFVCSVSVNSLLAWTGQSSRVVSSPELSLKGLGGPEVREAKKPSFGLMSFFCRDGEGSKHIILFGSEWARLKFGGMVRQGIG